MAIIVAERVNKIQIRKQTERVVSEHEMKAYLDWRRCP